MKFLYPSLDILIPTYNQSEILKLTLEALCAQKVTSDAVIRIIVSDDGSSDSTPATIRHLAATSPWPLQVISGPHTGSAAARNRALAVSHADIILFLGGDIIMRPGALQAHLDFHTGNPDRFLGALGFVAWDPRVRPTPFMEWMIHGGPQNNFDAIVGQDSAAPEHYFYGSHLSLKADIMRQEKFSEKFTRYGWEDLELGRRLSARGVLLRPVTNALSLHRHMYTISDIVKRQRAAGYSLIQYQQHHPQVSLAPALTTLRKTKFRLLYYSGLALVLRFVLSYSGKRWTTPRLFFALTVVEYWHGIISAQEG